MLLPKLPATGLQIALSTVMVLHIALPEIKEFTSQEMYGSEPTLLEFTGLNLFLLGNLFSTTLKQLD